MHMTVIPIFIYLPHPDSHTHIPIHISNISFGSAIPFHQYLRVHMGIGLEHLLERFFLFFLVLILSEEAFRCWHNGSDGIPPNPPLTILNKHHSCSYKQPWSEA